MNISLFLANRVGLKGGSSLSKFIIRIAIVAIALGVAVMILTSCMINGFRKEIKSKIFGFWGHIVITDSKQVLDTDVLPMKFDPEFIKSLTDIESVTYKTVVDEDVYSIMPKPETTTTLGGVSHVQGYANINSIIQTKTDFEGIVLKGVGADYNTDFFGRYVMSGELPNFKDTTASRDILISTKTAARLDLKVGDKMVVNFVLDRNKTKKKAFYVSGTYRTGLAEYDEVFAIIDIRHVQKLLGWGADEVAGLEVFADNVSEIEPINDYIFTQKLPYSLYAQTIRSKSPAIFDWLDLQDINEKVILLLMLLVSVINMVTTLMILIIDRSKMIGVLKVLGMPNWGIRKVFLYYALYVLFWGLLLGNFLGLGLAWVEDATHFIKLSEDDYYLSYAPIFVDFWQIIKINFITILVTFVVLVIPTYLITKIKPMKTLTFK